MGRLSGKVAIITGGARGMGAATARVFAEEGAKVVITDVLREDGETLAKSIGPAAIFRQHDVTSEEAWTAIAADTAKAFGRIDVLVNNAGILLSKAIQDMELAEFERVLRINLTGAFLGIKIVSDYMVKQRSGSIINISSADGLKAGNSFGAYCASKWGLRGFTKVAAMELGHKGVRVNSVHPGAVDTPMGNTDGRPREEISKYFGHVPLQRVGAPEEIARVSAFLASDDASYVNGAEIAVDGGMVLGFYYKGFPGAPDA